MPTELPSDEVNRYRRLLGQVREQTAVKGAAVRAMAALAWLALMTFQTWSAPVPYLSRRFPWNVGYLVASAALLVATRSRFVRQHSRYAFVLIDIPAIALIYASSVALSPTRIIAPLYCFVLATVLLMGFVLLTDRLLEIVLAACWAMLWEAMLMYRAGAWDHLLNVPVVFALAAGAGYAVSRQWLHLVNAAARDAALRERLGRYFSASVREQITAAGENPVPVQREATVLFVDLRGFTTISHGKDSALVFHWVDEFLSAMAQVVFECDGTLDKFLGDGLLAYFGAPQPTQSHAADAVRCALRMQAALKVLNALRASRGDAPLKMGIGIDSGLITVGTLGPPERREFTVLGSAVNLASRIEGLTKTAGVTVLASQAVRERAPDFDWLDFDDASVRGLPGKIAVYSPAALSGPR